MCVCVCRSFLAAPGPDSNAVALVQLDTTAPVVVITDQPNPIIGLKDGGTFLATVKYTTTVQVQIAHTHTHTLIHTHVYTCADTCKHGLVVSDTHIYTHIHSSALHTHTYTCMH